MGAFGCPLGALGASWGPRGAPLHPLGDPLGALWGLLGDPWVAFGGLWGTFGSRLDPPSDTKGRILRKSPPQSIKTDFDVHVEICFRALRALAHGPYPLGALWGLLEAPWVAFGGLLGGFGEPLSALRVGGNGRKASAIPIRPAELDRSLWGGVGGKGTHFS